MKAYMASVHIVTSIAFRNNIKISSFAFRTNWYEGSVFYEIHPARFPDSNIDGFGDLRGLQHRTDYLTKLGVVAVRLNSIFPSNKQSHHYQNVTTLLAIDDVLGTVDDLQQLVKTFHSNNLSLILDLPIYPFIEKLEPIPTFIEESIKHPMIIDEGTLRVARASGEKNTVTHAIALWMKCGIDGFYIKGLENMATDPLLLENIRAWKTLIGPNRILMINNELLEQVDRSTAEIIVKHVDLVDIFIDVTNGTKQIAEQINHSLNGVLRPGNGAFIQWSIGGVSELESHKSYELTTNGALAANIMCLMLPGSPNVYHGDANNEKSSHEQFSEPINSKHLHTLPAMAWNTVPQISENGGSNQSVQVNADDYDTIARMISLRDLSPSIYKNIVRKKGKYESNTSALYHENGNILILMRWYPRRNTFASISNFGNTNVSLDLTKYFYSGKMMIGGSTQEKVYFDQFEIGPTQTIIVKLDK